MSFLGSNSYLIFMNSLAISSFNTNFFVSVSYANIFFLYSIKVY